MATNQSTSFNVNKHNIAVLDFGVTSLKIVIVDPSHPEEPFHSQRIYLPLRTRRQEIDGELKTILRSYADYNIRKFILTTTSPLFASAKETIEFIINSVTNFIHPANIVLYTHDGEFVTIKQALENPSKVVSVGWKALGKGLWKMTKQEGLVVDFSTRTTSFIPIRKGEILSSSKSDHERMKNDELIFFGLMETNAAFIQPIFEYNGETFNLPFETHAITADVFLVTEDIQSSDYITNTPDKKAKFKEDALDRIKSMFCIVDDSFHEQDLIKIAYLLKLRMLEKINRLIKKKMEEYQLDKIIITGIGANILYQYLMEKNEYTNISKASDIIKTAEINPSFSLAYIYASKKMIADD